MPLASGADVAIGAYEFMLDTEGETPYVWAPENLFPTQAEIAGTDKQSANQNLLLWMFDNFNGGDGLKYYDEDQPARWHTGNNNPRAFPGAIQSPPTHSNDDVTTSSTPTGGGFFVPAGGNLWYFTAENGYHSANGSSWTENTDVATELPASYQITGAASNGEYAYIAASDGTNRGIWRVTSTTVVDDFVTAHANTAAYKALAVRDNFLYAWTGNHLFRYPLTATLPITHSTGSHRKHVISGETPASSVNADMVTSDDSVVYMRSFKGQTELYEYKIDPQTNKLGPRMFWKLPVGFTGAKICVNTGIIYVLGQDAERVGLFGYSLQSRQPLFLGYVGDVIPAFSAQFIAPSYGAQVLIGVDNITTNFVYVYDAELDAFSQLDERTSAADGTLEAGVTYEDLRLSASFSTTTTRFNQWVIDSDTPDRSWDWDSPAWDLKYPHEEKVLLGFHVIQDPNIATGTVNVDYQIDEDGAWLDAGTTTAAQMHNYLPVSTAVSTRKFRLLRVRMTGANGCRVFSITARTYINTKQEVWKLRLDLRNEPGSGRHPTNRTSASTKLRDNLHALVEAGNVVTFKDGTRRKRASSDVDTGYTEHAVMVEFPKGAMDSLREGVGEVILRSVEPSA